MAAADDDRGYELAMLVSWLVDHRHPAVLEGAVRRSGPTDAGHVVAVARWLSAAAETVLQVLPVLRGGTSDPAVAVASAAVSAPAARPGVSLVLAHDIELLGLPLLDLAADIGRRHQRGRLVIVSATMNAHGCYDHDAGTIGLAIDGHTRWADVVSVWGHELAHGLDPELGSGDIAQEKFAGQLGPLLVEHEPPSVAAAAPLVDRVALDRPLPLLGDVPPPGALSLFAFYRLARAKVPA